MYEETASGQASRVPDACIDTELALFVRFALNPIEAHMFFPDIA
jgi:hypothetical protein